MKTKFILHRLLLDFFSLIYLPTAILSILLFLLKPRTQSIFFISLAFAGLSFLLIPYNVWDLARHYESFLLIKDMSLSELYNYGHIRYLPLHMYMWLISTLGLPKEVLPAISVFFSYYILLKIIVSIYESQRMTTPVFFVFAITIWCTIPFIGIASSLRQHLAIIVCIYGIWNFYLKGNSKYLVYLLVSLFIHSSVIILFFILLINRLRFGDIKKRAFSLVFFALMITGLSSELFFSIVMICRDVLIENGFYFAMYFDKEVMDESVASLSKSEYILRFFVNPMLFYVVAWFYILSSYAICREEKLIHNFLYFLLFFIFIISPSETIFSRFSFAFTILGVLYIFNYKIGEFSALKKACFFASLLLAVFVNTAAKINSYKLVVIPSWSRVIYTPSILYPVYSTDDIKLIKVE